MFAFKYIVGIPFSYSIAEGLALGFINCAVVKGFSGRAREISWLTYLLALVLVYFVFVRSRMGQRRFRLPPALVRARAKAPRQF